MDKKMMASGLSMLILQLLEEKPMYGYHMIKQLEEKSEQAFSLKEGTLYPLLHSLEQQGDIEGYEEKADTGRVRRYYRITPQGKFSLKERRKTWEDYEKAVNRVLGGVSHA